MTPAEIVAPIAATDVEGDVRSLSGADPVEGGPIVSRDLHHPDLERAHDALVDALAAIPTLAVRDEPFAVTGVPGVDAATNVIADLPGADPDAPWLLIGAHYDSIASFDEDWADPSVDPAPGADDDASGVAAVLAVARALGGYAPGFDRNVRFVLFSAEEYGLQGAFAHAEALDVPAEAMIQLDPVGYDPGDAAWLWVSRDAQSAALADDFAAAAAGAALQVNVVDAANLGGDARSDHYPFWETGVPALHLASFPQPPTYHTMQDTIANVDPTFTREVAVAVGAHAATWAGPRPEDEPRRGCATTQGGALAAGIAALVARARRPERCAAGAAPRAGGARERSERGTAEPRGRA